MAQESLVLSRPELNPVNLERMLDYALEKGRCILFAHCPMWNSFSVGSLPYFSWGLAR
jgi:hypothetical protein